MADVVQYKMERMVNELDDLERRALFTRREIAEIVKQRRKFEYRLKRPSPLKQDYLAYIDYEKQLDALRLLRKKAVAREVKKKGNKKMKKSISDFAGVSRIVEIYRLATNRFKGDIQLWFQYLEFCRERRNGRIKKALAQVIRYHPKVPGVWIYAAALEFDHNSNVTAARALMLNALRACPNSEDLWIEYIRMELTYLNKLKARKIALGDLQVPLVGDGSDPQDKEWHDENKELFMALGEKTENYEESNIQKGESEKNLDLFSEQGLRILRTVYDDAVKALPASFSLRIRFFEILESADLAHSGEVLQEILTGMKRDFSKEPVYWDWLAKLEIADLKSTQSKSKGKADRLQKAIQVYEEALNVVPSATIFDLYIKFLMSEDVRKDEETHGSGFVSSSCDTVDPISHVLAVYEKAENMGCVTEDLAYQHISFLLELGRLDETSKLAEKHCIGKFSNAVNLWVLRLSIEMMNVTTESSCPSRDGLSLVFELLRDVLAKVTVIKAESLWLMALKFFANHKHYFDKLVEISLVLLAKDGGSDDGFSLSSAIVNFVLQKHGILRAREMYKRFLALPHPGLAIYRTSIELEQNLASAGDKDCLVIARKLYDSALATYDQDVNLWQDYYSMESKVGTSQTTAAVQWRARRTLKCNAVFLACRDS